MPVRNGANETFAAFAAPPPSGHVRAGSGLVDEDEFIRVKLGLVLQPQLPRRLDVFPFLLAGVRRFF
jgi:hypothetical protein